MSSHLRLVWSERIKAEREAMYTEPPPDVFDGILYRSDFTRGQTITIVHPDMGGVEVDAIVTGEIPVSGILIVQVPGVDGMVHVPLEYVKK